jgi:hypothetical protein
LYISGGQKSPKKKIPPLLATTMGGVESIFFRSKFGEILAVKMGNKFGS